MEGNKETVNFLKEDQSISVQNQSDKIVKTKEDHCSKKRKERKRKSKENEIVCDSRERIRNTQEEDKENIGKHNDKSVKMMGDEHDRSKKREKRKRKSKENEIACDSWKSIRNTEEEENLNMEKLNQRIVKMKGDEHDCSKKRKNKSEEDEIACDSRKRIRKKQEEEIGKFVKMKEEEYDSSKKRKKRKKKSKENEIACGSRKSIRNSHEEEEENEIQGSGFGENLKKKKGGVAKGDIVLGKRFTKEEDEIIKKAVLDYVDKNQLGEKGIDMVMNCSKHPNLRGCWKEIAEALPHRPLRNIYVRARRTLGTINRGKWTKEEISYIQEMYDKHGADWKTMAKKLGRFAVHVCNMYWFTKLPNMKKGQWTQDEYQALFDLVHADLEAKVFSGEKKSSKHGMLRDNIRWAAISDKLSTRHHLRCCSKWYQRLSSRMVLDGTWADADDYRMLIALYKLDASCEEEVEWDSLIEHRTGELCRKRWKQMVRDIGEHGSKSFVEQVEVLSQRYCPGMLQVREKLDSRPIVA